jgi:phi LC3 family holin|uniref:Holin n=1 Tax=Siphoviridae sp. ctqwY3 TaxID=2827951 RepID=A0A8S5S7B6_9CAUD|nr:MAG TPA: holin [Siphoviridae sp. ctqwY3]
MNKINWKIRFKNPVFIAQIIMAILLPILAYFGMNAEDLTSWGKLGNILLSAISNPYVVGLVIVSLWNAINDPTTTGITDSTNALNYEKPNNN